MPIPKIGLLQAIALVVLNVFIVRDIARLWHFQKGGKASTDAPII
ncbi:hypothetical protein [Calothrix sp. UHCC 0171]|nr:hypothetical protein [Calothrix sp. UHCC 0171]MEA5571946.1 hypothetical protein [Calothrix sp. UHCC 0171]